MVCVLGVLALVLRLIALPSASTDYDEGVYWQSLRAMSLGHPLFTSIFSSQPPFFLLSLYPIYSFFALFLGQTLVAARLGIVLYSLFGLAAMYLAARSIGGRSVGLLALALLVADPFYLKESYTLQAEVPAVAWELVALALGVAAANASGRTKHLLALAAGVALGLGILTKLFDVFILVPIVLYLLAPAAQAAWSAAGGRLRFRGRQALIAAGSPALPDVGLLLAGCLLAFVLVLLPFAGNLGTIYDQVIHYHLAAGQYAGHSLGYNIKLVLNNPSEYPLALLALISVVMAVRERWWVLLVPVLWLLVTLAFLLKQQPLLDHDRLILVPPLVLVGSLILWRYRPQPAGSVPPGYSAREGCSRFRASSAATVGGGRAALPAHWSGGNS